VLVSIDSGSIEIDAPGGTMSTLGVDSYRDEWDNVASIDAAHAAFLSANGEISLQNTTRHAVVVLLIAMEGTPMGSTRGSP
jgi:hypothetical protein